MSTTVNSTDSIPGMVLEALAEAIVEVPEESKALRSSVTRLGDGQTNPDE